MWLCVKIKIKKEATDRRDAVGPVIKVQFLVNWSLEGKTV